MLSEFIATHRSELIVRAQQRVAARSAPRPTAIELESGVPVFLDQLIETLRLSLANTDAISQSAGIHGRALLRTGFTVAQVVHDYGDICQEVTGLANETNAPITVGEFRTLNRCLDDAIAHAVTEFEAGREKSIEDQGTRRLGALVDAIRTRLSTAKLSFALLKQGHVGIGGSTGAILGNSLRGACNLIDHSFAQLRLESGESHLERVLVSELLEQVEIDGFIEAESSGLSLSVTRGEPGLHVQVDRQLIGAALGGLVQNALRYTRSEGQVSLVTLTSPERVTFEVTDECGGLPPGVAAQLSNAFESPRDAQSVFGAGLAVIRWSVEACGGELGVRDVPGSGCTFTMALPRAHSVE